MFCLVRCNVASSGVSDYTLECPKLNFCHPVPCYALLITGQQ